MIASSVRTEVLDHIAELIHSAEAQGLDGLAVARKSFPGTPESVLGEAIWLAEERRAEQWWSSVEKTIDGEVIKAALLESGGSR